MNANVIVLKEIRDLKNKLKQLKEAGMSEDSAVVKECASALTAMYAVLDTESLLENLDSKKVA